MVVRFLFLVVSCFIVTVRAEDACDKWRDHPNFNLLPRKDECGKAKINYELGSRILNGKAAEHGSLPWMAYIRLYQGRGFLECGGSVINDNYVLTAAHCFKNKLPQSKIIVYLGLHNRQVLNDSLVKEYIVSELIIVPTFDKHTSKHDIALLRLKTKINFLSAYINSICLPTSCELANKTFLGEKMTVAGWGRISPGQKASTLQKTVLEVKNCPKFNSLPNASSILDWPLLCMGDGNGKTCGGDSGGPAMYESSGNFIQVGISSFSSKNCTSGISNKPSSKFTKVAPFMDWILETIRP